MAAAAEQPVLAAGTAIITTMMITSRHPGAASVAGRQQHPPRTQLEKEQGEGGRWGGRRGSIRRSRRGGTAVAVAVARRSKGLSS